MRFFDLNVINFYYDKSQGRHMRLKGHFHTGIVFGICTAVLMNNYHYEQKTTMITSIAAAVGAVAPDFMEMGIIKHRTWTHWPLGWALVLLAAYYGAIYQPENSDFYFGLGGFSMGALLHVLADMPYYKGTPLINPRRRFPTLQLEFEPRLNKLVENVYIVAMIGFTGWFIFG